MVDYVNISVKAGNGGDGHVSFQTKKGQIFGVADGGDGGKGGDVFIVPTRDLNTLAPFRYKKDFEADRGGHGGRNNRTGEVGNDLYLEVPLGTLIKNDKGEIIFDITGPEDKVMLAKGGEGGRGNAHLKHLVAEKKKEGERGLIRVFERGKDGEEINLTLELKILADVGLVGLPNAGKSTLISKLTAAKPKIANYPFTTLEPNLGVMHLQHKEIVIADIPGLIEGASAGKGLGDQFLRHIERTRLLLHLVSLESLQPLKDWEIINSELKNYSEKLKETPQVVCLTKTDLVNEETINEVEKLFKKNLPSGRGEKVRVLKISAFTGEGLEELKKELQKKL